MVGAFFIDIVDAIVIKLYLLLPICCYRSAVTDVPGGVGVNYKILRQLFSWCSSIVIVSRLFPEEESLPSRGQFSLHWQVGLLHQG
ncbi:hypothetical protein [Photorhabdus sp. SF281]|uniref:hypothetical protein n=1 Tax=Photorhabdus sp. SF281 TaxID=3459527 RepID=UPI0040447178